jgi:hypothetical protein
VGINGWHRRLGDATGAGRTMGSMNLGQHSSEVDVVAAGPAGVARPGVFDPTAEMPRVQRSFAFLDLCRFTAFTDQHGVH